MARAHKTTLNEGSNCDARTKVPTHTQNEANAPMGYGRNPLTTLFVLNCDGTTEYPKSEIPTQANCYTGFLRIREHQGDATIEVSVEEEKKVCLRRRSRAPYGVL